MHELEQTVEMLLVGASGWHSVIDAAGLQFAGSRPPYSVPVALRINPSPPALPPLLSSQAALRQAGKQKRGKHLVEGKRIPLKYLCTLKEKCEDTPFYSLLKNFKNINLCVDASHLLD